MSELGDSLHRPPEYGTFVNGIRGESQSLVSFDE